MARSVANVNITTDNFENLILKLNNVLAALSNEIVTANTSMGRTGNTQFQRHSTLYGSFGANTIVVSDELRGGNTSGGLDDLKITTPVRIFNPGIPGIEISIGDKTSKHSEISDVYFHIGDATSNTKITETDITISDGSVNSKLNKDELIFIGTSSTSKVDSESFSIGQFLANGSHVIVGDVEIDVNNIMISSTDPNGTNVLLSNSENILLSSANTTEGNSLEATSKGLVITKENPLGTIDKKSAITPNEVIIGSTNTILDETSLLIDNLYYTDTIRNDNLGTDIINPIEFYSFDKSEFSSGKFEVQIKNGTNIQFAEMIVTHNDTDARIAVYGVLSIPPAVNELSTLLGDFSVQVVGNFISLRIQQNIASSSLKAIAHLITR